MDILLTTVGIGVITTNVVCSLLSNTCSKSLELITRIGTTKILGFEDIDEIIFLSDIRVKLNKLILLCEHLNGCKIENKCIINGIKDMEDIILNINDELGKIDELKKYQGTLYFNDWRFRMPDLSINKKQLESYIKILNIRFDDFFKLKVLIYNNIL